MEGLPSCEESIEGATARDFIPLILSEHKFNKSFSPHFFSFFMYFATRHHRFLLIFIAKKSRILNCHRTEFSPFEIHGRTISGFIFHRGSWVFFLIFFSRFFPLGLLFSRASYTLFWWSCLRFFLPHYSWFAIDNLEDSHNYQSSE